MKKLLVISVLIVVIALGGLLAYVRRGLPNVGPSPRFTIERTAERISRGEYLANHVAVCVDCHSSRDWKLYSGPILPGTIGKGGELFDQRFGFPGTYYSRNITPAGIRDWTDGELFRLITTGVKRDGTAIFPVMPFPYYARMDEEDIKSIIAYIRTLPAIENEIPPSRSDFPMNFIINTIPTKSKPQNRPPTTDTVAYGAYLTNASACMECHTRVERGQVVPAVAFSGGREFPLPDGGIVRSPNITSDAETGIGNLSRDSFIGLFKGRKLQAKKPPAGPYNTFMPWSMYGGMTERDLGAIYDYLRTIKPIKNQVDRFTAPVH